MPIQPPSFDSPIAPPPPEEDIFSGLRKWSDLTPPIQTHIVQSWLAGPYDKLTDFCIHHSLDYSSIHQVFSHKSRDLIEQKKSLVIAGVPGHEIQSHLSADKMALDHDHVASIVMACVKHQIMSGNLSLDKLMALSTQLSKDRQRYGDHVIEAAKAGATSTTPVSTGSGAGKSLLSPELRKIVNQKLADAGEKLAKLQELNKDG